MSKKTNLVTITEENEWTPVTNDQETCLVQLRSGFAVEVAVATQASDLVAAIGHDLRSLPGSAADFKSIPTGDKVFARTTDGDATLLVTAY